MRVSTILEFLKASLKREMRVAKGDSESPSIPIRSQEEFGGQLAAKPVSLAAYWNCPGKGRVDRPDIEPDQRKGDITLLPESSGTNYTQTRVNAAPKVWKMSDALSRGGGGGRQDFMAG